MSALAPSALSFCSLILSTSSGSLLHTRLPTDAVPLTTIGIGTAILAASPPAVSIRPMSTSVFLRIGLVVYGSAPTFAAHRRAAPFTPSTELATPAPVSAAFSPVDLDWPSAGSSSSFTSSTALSPVRLALRPRFVPKRLMPPPTPLAVASGSLTADETPLPTFSTDVPADFRNTSLFDTFSSSASAPTSCSRISSIALPSASSGP